MIIGYVKIENNAVVTHRDSYLLSNLSVVSVRRPYLAGAILLGIGVGGFALAFADLLYGGEILTLIGIAITIILLGSQIGQLSLLSRDLKGTELSSAVWGRPGALQSIRARIVQERQNQNLNEGLNPRLNQSVSKDLNARQKTGVSHGS